MDSEVAQTVSGAAGSQKHLHVTCSAACDRHQATPSLSLNFPSAQRG